MLTNTSLTIYHKGYDDFERIETWQRFNYDNVWMFGGKGASLNKGFTDSNDVQVRIPYDKNENLNIDNFAIGDIIVQGNLSTDIETQQDLEDYLVYNITSITNNTYGINKHIHLGGK